MTFLRAFQSALNREDLYTKILIAADYTRTVFKWSLNEDEAALERMAERNLRAKLLERSILEHEIKLELAAITFFTALGLTNDAVDAENRLEELLLEEADL